MATRITPVIRRPPHSSLLRGLVSYWELDEPSGQALDAHGTNDLSDNNTVGSAAGKIRGGRDFEEGSSEFFDRASNASLQTGDIDFTFSCWVKPETISGSDAWIFIGKDDDGGAGREYLLGYNGFTGQWFGSVFKSGPTEVSAAQTELTPSTGVWYLLVFWHDATADTVNLQINNGVVNSTATGGALQSAGSTSFRIGARNAGTSFPTDGVLDECGFWKRVLTARERSLLYNGGRGLSYPFTTSRRRMVFVPTTIAEGQRRFFLY